MEKKIGIYICSGCGIGKCLDIEKLKDVASGDKDIVFSRDHAALCSEEGYESIRSSIEDDKLDAVILAACSPRYKTDIFDVGDNVMLERVSIREQVAWTGIEGDEDSLMTAEDYLRMGIAKVKSTENPQPYFTKQLHSDILVVGSGVTGLSAALQGAKAGYNIRLVEKEETLGGRAADLYKQVPFVSPFNEAIMPIAGELAREAESNPGIKIYTSTEISEISGQPGDFHVSLSNGNMHSIEVGAVVAAMGWKPYDATKLGHLAYGVYENVLTNTEFEELVKNSQEKLPANILFIQCAGSRDNDHLPYCSSYCCSTSLKQAKYARDLDPDASVFIVYKDMRCPGKLEEFYKEVQKDDGIFFTKGDVVGITEDNGKLRVNVANTLLGEDIEIVADMIVLATGMEPSSTEGLNLDYRMGKGLPELKYNFSDSHFICFPYETRRTGIYAAGCVRSPMDIASCMEDAAGAMLKAIQCIEATGRGEAVHPRSGDKTYPDLFLDRCTDCKRCTEECPFGAYDENEKGTPLPNPARCRRCGICLGSCPERVINFSNYSINSISSIIKSIHIPDEFEEKPRILVFVCENDAYPAFDMAAEKRLKYSPYIRIIPVRCIGSINKVWISDALSQGFDGIMQIGCKPGDDYQCHFIEGSSLTEIRGENIQDTFNTMMLEPERLKTVFVEITDYDKIPGIINDYVELIEEIGPNPFKDV